MRTVSNDPNSRENFMLAYKVATNLVKRHHEADRLRLLSYIDKTQGYYTIYLAQDPANPLSTAFGYFNVSLGNFRSINDNELYYYYNAYKDGKTEDEIVEKIEDMIKLSYDEENESDGSNLYYICMDLIDQVVQSMADLESGFAVENEICPYMGPYSRVADNQLWFDLLDFTKDQFTQRCNYDYFAIGTGVPGGPVYRAWAFISNQGMLYLKNHEPVDIVKSCREENGLQRIIELIESSRQFNR
jgi:hypothetical protein